MMDDLKLIDYLLAHPNFLDTVQVTIESIVAEYEVMTVEASFIIQLHKEVKNEFTIRCNKFIFSRNTTTS